VPTEEQINKEFTDLMAGIVAEQASFSWGKYLAAKAAFGDYEEWWQAAVDGSYNYLNRWMSYIHVHQRCLQMVYK